MVEINYLAVLVAGIAAMIVGYIWYSPWLFGKAWMKESGMNMGEGNTNMTKLMLTTFIVTLVMAYMLAYVLGLLEVATMAEGVQTAFWLWLGFVAASLLINYLYSNRSTRLWVLDAGHYLATMIAMAVILTVWK